MNARINFSIDWPALLIVGFAIACLLNSLARW